jgi:prolyl-tRNA editing enzyme YbaK/EbsC (Cys-tRNA(Pro) deacylase)
MGFSDVWGDLREFDCTAYDGCVHVEADLCAPRIDAFMSKANRMLAPADLARFVEENGIEAELVALTEPTPTVPAAAEAVGCATEQIGKSILFLVDGEPLLVIANVEARVQYKRLADFLGVSRRRVKLANAETVLRTLGYPVGTVPPFGHAMPVRTFLEQGVLAQEEIWVGGGGIDMLLHIHVDELRRVIGPDVVPLTE